MTYPLSFIVGWAGALIGVLLLLASGWSAWKSLNAYADWMTVEGKVISIRFQSLSPGNPHYYPVVEFQDKSGRMIQFESRLGFYPAKHRVGQLVPVLYPTQTPENAILDIAAAKWTPPFALLFFGAIFLILGIMVIALT